MPELVGQRHQVGLGRQALLPRLAVARRGDEGGRDALLGAGPQQVGVGRRRSAHEDEVDLAVRQVVDVGHRLHAEDLGAVAVGGEDLALVAAGQDVVEADEAELARVGRGAGHEHAAGLEQRPEPIVAMVGRSPWRSSPHLHERVHRDRAPVDDEQRVEVGRGDVGPLRRPPSDRPRSTSATAARSTAGSPRNGPSSACSARSSIISSASTRVTGTSRKLTSATASARMPPTPSITVMPNCGSSWSPAISSRVARSMGATSRWTSPSSGVAAASSASAASRTCVGRAEPEPHQAPLGLVGDGVAPELDHDREPDLVGRRHRVGGGRHDPLGGERHTERGEQLFRRRLGERGHGPSG